MNPDISFLHELWDGIKTFIPKKERLAIAEAIVRSFDDYADIEAIEDHLNEFDTVMRTALKSHFDFYDEEEDDDDFGEW